MKLGCILFMLFGFCVTWGGLSYSLYVQIRESSKAKNK